MGRMFTIDANNRNVMNERTGYCAIVANIGGKSPYLGGFVMRASDELNVVATSGFRVAFHSSRLRKPRRDLREGSLRHSKAMYERADLSLGLTESPLLSSGYREVKPVA
jgi:hypothetical protein